MNSNRTIETSEELAEAADALFAWGMPARLVEEYALVGFGGLVTDVNWVPTLSFVAAAITDLNLDCDALVSLGREVFAEAYPFPEDAEEVFPFDELDDIHRRIWAVCVGDGSLPEEINSPEMSKARLQLFLLVVAISAHVGQSQSSLLRQFVGPGDYIRNMANSYEVEINVAS
jgi:hypothetical protein